MVLALGHGDVLFGEDVVDHVFDQRVLLDERGADAPHDRTLDLRPAANCTLVELLEHFILSNYSVFYSAQ